MTNIYMDPVKFQFFILF